MFFNKKSVLLFAMFVSFLLIIAACSGGSESDGDQSTSPSAHVNPPGETADTLSPKPQPTVPAKEITLKVVTYAKVNFDSLITDEVKKKFPEITFEAILPNTPNELGQIMNDMIIGGQKFDLISASSGIASGLGQDQSVYDLTSFATKFNQDMTVLDRDILDSAKQFGLNGELYMMPVNYNGPFVLMYNKEIFERFAVPFPEEGMTWEEAYDLTVQMTRTVDGMDYKGFATPNHAWLNNQLSPQWVDPTTLKASIYTDGWIKVFDNYKRLYSVPGNDLIGTNPQLEAAFLKTQNVAMLSIPNLWKKDTLKESNVDWDMVSIPVYTDQPDRATPAGFAGLSISMTSEHPDETFRVIQYLISDEMQKRYVEKENQLTVLNNPEIKNLLGKSDPYLSSKNMAALYTLKPALPIIVTEFDQLMRPLIQKAFLSAVKNGEGVHEALRKAEEEGNQKINTEMGK